MKASKAQSIISLITCFFLILAVTICKGTSSGISFLIMKMKRKSKAEIPAYCDKQMTEYK